MMQIRKLDGSSVIEINAIDSRLKMAVDAEAKGQMTKARTMLEHALKAERDFWVAKVAKARMLGEKFPAYPLQDDADAYALDVRGG
jgi:hypothetical protein